MSKVFDWREAQVGKHYFIPGGAYKELKTFSVGCCEAYKGRSVEGMLLGKAKVRVSGPTSNPQAVYDEATEVCKDLDAGTYSGPKTVRVKG